MIIAFEHWLKLCINVNLYYLPFEIMFNWNNRVVTLAKYKSVRGAPHVTFDGQLLNPFESCQKHVFTCQMTGHKKQG